jgi:hypothetical protein
LITGAFYQLLSHAEIGTSIEFGAIGFHPAVAGRNGMGDQSSRVPDQCSTGRQE